jgi:endoglucanase
MIKYPAKPVRLVSYALLILSICYSRYTNAQTIQRIKFTTITSSINTGQDYTPWLNDDTTSLVQSVWQNNFVWVDLTLPLTQHSIITSLSFYDYEGVFTGAPDSIYALNGNIKTLIGTFIGPGYMVWDGFTLATPIQADAIIIHKYANNIPQKVDIYGYPVVTTPPKDTTTTPVDTAATVATGTYMKIPIDSTRWYQLDNTTNGLGGLTNGILAETVNTGYSKLIANFDAYYPLLPGEKIDLNKIQFYCYQGGLGTNPMTIDVIDSAGVRTNIATYVGGAYQSWLGPYPGVNTYMLKKPVSNIKYIVINSNGGYPAEMHLFGYYTPPTTPVTAAKPVAQPLSQYFGVNGYEWNFENGANPGVVSAPLFNAMQSFTQVRHYLDWNKLETTQGDYTFNPAHSGGWNYDAMYKSCSTAGMLVLGDIKTQPVWMTATYPANVQDSENVPVLYGADFSNPLSYLLQAKVAFQYAARYGSNSAVSSGLLSVDTTIRWTNDPENVVKKALNLIHYVECDNERDKWWKGRIAYQTSYEYAANMSAFYDGNKNTMGAGIGVKNADPNMQVVMGGLASADPSYVHGMIEWCRQNRGLNANGGVNLCFDVINYHYYSNNGVSGGNATIGVAPELSGAFKTAQAFVTMAHQYANNMPVWVTEAGYDVNAGSPQRAPAIGNKTALQVEADWILRTSLMYARAGIARVFFYESYDDNAANPTQYASSGLLNTDQSRRPATDFMVQTNKLFGSYTFQSSKNTSNLIVDTYVQDTSKMYMLVVPDQVGRTLKYDLLLGTADSAYIYSPVAGVNDMAKTAVKLKSGRLLLTVTETPEFVVPVGIDKSIATTDNLLLAPVPKTPGAGINVYPNPSAHYVTVAFNSISNADVTIKVTDVNSGKLYKSYTFPKNSADFANTIDISSVPMGVCIVQVIQGNQVTMKKVLKTYQ